MKKRTTIQEVAKAAGVSIGTVSKVIHNTGQIKKSTREKVLSIIEKLNYEPNVIASALKSKKTRSLGVLIPDLANPFFADLARSLEDLAYDLNYKLTICSTDYDKDKELEYIDFLQKNRVDGIIIASGFETISNIKELVEGTPLCAVVREFENQQISSVSPDNYLGGYMAAEHLIKLGHSNIGFIAKDVWSNRERKNGYKAAMEENGLKNNILDLGYVNNANVPDGEEMMDNYFKLSTVPTAIIACNNLLAAGAMKSIKNHYLRIPEDISLLGFDNTVLAQTLDPTLTTIVHSIKDMASKVLKVLVDEINEPKNKFIQIRVPNNLIVRDSTQEIKKIK